MTDPKQSPTPPPDDDSPAVDGMLRELSHEGEPANEELIARIMSSVEEVDQELHPPLTVIPMRYLWMAAAVLIVVGLGIIMVMSKPAIAHLEAGTLTVTRGGRTTVLHEGDKLVADDQVVANDTAVIRLTDDSVLTLAGGTDLTLPKPDAEYRVRLDLAKGRIFCRVSKRPGRFLIDAGLPVEVLGTTFGVNRTDQYTRTAVYEGRVKVGEGAGTLLLRGKVAEFTPDLPSPMGVAVDANDELAWARPDMGFTNDSLATVAAWIMENSRFTFEIPKALRDKRVAFSYAKGDDLVTAIQLMTASVNLTTTFNDHVCTIATNE